jgi:predicted DNA-binding transcriptional regulator AlpA
MSAKDSSNHPDDTADAVDPLLLPDVDTAALLRISRAHLHRLRSAGMLPAPVRLGRAVRWRRSDIEAWILMGCPSRSEFEVRLNGKRLKIG